MKDLFGNEIIEPAPAQKRGGGNSVYVINGCSNHCAEARADEDFYATPTEAVEMLLEMEKFGKEIWEPCAGMGHISKVLIDHGHDVKSTDLVNRGFTRGGVDFMQITEKDVQTDIVTNPPYSLAREFVEKALDVVAEGRKVAMFLKLTFAEGIARRELFKTNPPIRVWVASKRLECGKNGVFSGSSAVAYAWWVWQKGFKGNTTLGWFN